MKLNPKTTFIKLPMLRTRRSLLIGWREIMANYLVTYDLIKTKDYPKLYEGIKSSATGGWAHILGSVWIVNSDKTSKEMVEHIKQHMDNDDKLFVAPIDTSKWCSINLPQEKVDWLKQS